MRDYLAWRLAFGVTTPSTNTVVQPEYDDLRPAGVTNHLARMVIADNPVTCDADFERQLEAIDRSLEDAVARVMEHFAAQSPRLDHTDGISADFGDWRFNLRSSSTEPLLRLNVETRGDRLLLDRKVAELTALIAGR